MRKIFLSIFIFFSSILYCSEKESLILVSRDSGLFSVFMDVTAILNCYDQGKIKGVQIDFQKTGLYYDKDRGENWWQYYFEPICLGDMNEPSRFTCWGNEAGADMHIPLCQYLVFKKYIHLKLDLKVKISRFIHENFEGFHIIGVHYRGTDKKTETGRVSYEEMMHEINLQIGEAITKRKKWKIFLATDENQFLEKVKKKYKDKVCYIDATRADDENSPLHTNSTRNPYKCGEEAIMDWMLLASSNFLLRTNSNLSACCLYVNPWLPNKCISGH